MRTILSERLAKEHYSVLKYVPFGPIDKLIPYLMRRASESYEVVTKLEEQVDQILDEMRYRIRF